MMLFGGRPVILGLVVLLVAPYLASCRQPVSAPRTSFGAVAPAPAFVNGGPCEPTSDPRLPSRAGCVTSVSAEGKSLFAYAKTGRDHLPKSWHLRLVEHDRLLVDRDLRAGTVTAYPRVAAVTDVDRNGVPDWWVKTRDYASHGAPWGGLFLFVGIGESIAPLRYRGATLVIDFGGIARLGDGATCRSGDLLLLRAEATDRQNQTWSTSQRRFSISGSNAKLVERTHGTLAIDGYNDPDLDPYYEVECFGTNFGVFAPPS